MRCDRSLIGFGLECIDGGEMTRGANSSAPRSDYTRRRRAGAIVQAMRETPEMGSSDPRAGRTTGLDEARPLRLGNAGAARVFVVVRR